MDITTDHPYALPDPPPENPPIGGFCDYCGHLAGRHWQAGCDGFPDRPCECEGMTWNGRVWPAPWLPAPEGLEVPQGCGLRSVHRGDG